MDTTATDALWNVEDTLKCMLMSIKQLLNGALK